MAFCYVSNYFDTSHKQKHLEIVTGNTAPVFGILNFQNGTGMQLNILNTAGVNVAGTANFLNGITTTVRSNTSTGAMRFQNGATYTGSVNNVLTSSGADAQEVNGYVGKIGNTSFIYPVGSGTDARPLQISAPASATDEYDVAWIVGDPTNTGDPSNGNVFHSVASVLFPVFSVSTAGQWDWIPVSGTGAGLTVTVSIPDESAFAATSDLRLVGWNGSQWIDLSGVATASSNTENSTLSGTIQAGISAIGIGSATYPLPLTLLDFNAVKQNNNSLLTWTTTNEVNTANFVVERSTDGKTFTAIGTVAAAGNSNTSLNYSFKDNDPATGVDYYRLKMVNKDGTFTYSAVKLLNFDGGIIVYPNPATDVLTIKGIEGGMELRVMDAAGRIIYTKMAVNSIETIQMQTLAEGTYFLQIVKSNSVLNTVKFAHINR